MNKYIILALVIFILLTAFILMLMPKSSNFKEPIQEKDPLQSNSSTLPIPMPPKDLIEYQSSTDKQYADSLKEQDQKYPWLQKLPLQTSSYFVYFDTTTNSFKAEIFSQENYTELQNEIRQNLGGIGVNLSQYQIDWELKI